MGKNQIKVINRINDFKFIIREWKAIEGRYNTPLNIEKEKLSNYRLDALLIFYTLQKEYVEQCIYWCSSSDTKIIELNQDNFTPKLLNELISCFDLIIETHRFGHKYLSCKENNLYTFSPTISIKKSNQTDNYFIIIYYFDDGESRRNPQLYVHGIWEIELSEELKRILYLEI